MKDKIGYIILGVFVCVFTFYVITLNSDLSTSVSSVAGQSNKKVEWGIKRAENHMQPDLGSSNFKLLKEYDGIAMGSNENKYLYLTFDNGYEAGYTAKILDILKENEVKAAFFITAHYLNTASELVQRMIEEGHIVGNHTVNHKSMPSITDEEIETEVMKLHQSIYEKFNYEMRYIRPPKGEFSERTLKMCSSLGYKNVMWSFAYCDWDEKNQPSTEKSIEIITNNFHPGEIILLHSNSKTNSEVLDIIVKSAKEQGYEFKTLDQFE